MTTFDQTTKSDGLFEKLVAVVPSLDGDSFFLKAGKIEDPYEEVAVRISESEAQKVRSLNISGVSVHREQWRFYPAGTLAAQVLGFIGYDDNNIVTGRYGLERFYNDVLKRESKDLFVNFFAEVFANVAQTIFHGDENREGDITLTIEPHVENFLEQELAKISATWKSDLTGGLVINPKTGAIYAMGTLPSFNPNTFNTEKKSSSLILITQFFMTRGIFSALHLSSSS